MEDKDVKEMGQTPASDSPAPNEPPQGEPPRKQMRISSPEQVDDYIHVTTPGMWLLAVAMLVLLCAGMIWAFAARVELNAKDQNGQPVTEYIAPASFLTDGNVGN